MMADQAPTAIQVPALRFSRSEIVSILSGLMLAMFRCAAVEFTRRRAISRGATSNAEITAMKVRIEWCKP